jgi:hypothetical protein
MQSTPDLLFPRVTAFFELVSLGFATIGVRAASYHAEQEPTTDPNAGTSVTVPPFRRGSSSANGHPLCRNATSAAWSVGSDAYPS